MSTTTRLTLHDCKVDLRLPATVPADTTLSTEEQVLQAAASPNDLSECYIGSTIFVLLTLTPPTSPLTLLSATRALTDLTVQLVTPTTRAAVRLPVLREAAWACTRHALVKGVWALLRTPPGANDLSTPPTTGKHQIVVSLRERHSTPRNASVWATIDRAGRLFAKTFALSAERPVMIASPIELSCNAVCVAGSADRVLIAIVARNVTSDAFLAVIPPYINLGASRVVHELERDPVGTPVYLDTDYELVPMFEKASVWRHATTSTSTPQQDDDDSSAGEQSGDSCEDYGLFMPSFHQQVCHAARLGPREVYNFSYMVMQKGGGSGSGGNGGISGGVGGNGGGGVHGGRAGTGTDAAGVGTWTKGRGEEEMRLSDGECVQTAVSVAWRCSTTEGEAGEVLTDIENEDTQEGGLERELSGGRLLASGKRGNVAVETTHVRWRPVTLVGGVLVTISGPASTRVGATMHVSISVMNQMKRAVERASVHIQSGEIGDELVALRTVIAIGRIDAGAETSLQLPCLAVSAGAHGLGAVRVMDEGRPGAVWVARSEFRVLVLDDDADADVDSTAARIGRLVAR